MVGEHFEIYLSQMAKDALKFIFLPEKNFPPQVCALPPKWTSPPKFVEKLLPPPEDLFRKMASPPQVLGVAACHAT